jgi:hypothetical protein
LDEEENSFREMRYNAEAELNNFMESKAKLRDTEMELTTSAENEFYERIHEGRELDREKERLEKQTRDDIMTLEDLASDLVKKIGFNAGEGIRLEKDIRSMKEHLQVRKN